MPAIHVATVTAATTAATLTLIAAVHVYWAVGGPAGLSHALPSTPGENKPVFKPSRFATLLVACALAVTAWIVLANTPDISVPTPWPASWNRHATLALAALFALRALGDFRYVGLTKRIRQTPFARADTHYYTPLCALLATACTSLVW